MNYLRLKEIRKIQLDILNYIKKICDTNNIKYFIISGTLLGAVKYKGYIPWDDDIDICLFRDDYKKLINFINKDNNEDYQILSLYNTKDYYYTYSKVVYRKTKLIENSRKIKELGVYVDVFPIDYYTGDYNRFKRKIKFINNMATKRYRIKNDIGKSANLNMPSQKVKFLFIKKIVYNMVDILSLPLGYKFWGLLYDRIVSKHKSGNNVIIGLKYLPSFEAKLFKEYDWYEFEGYKLRSIKNYDHYLKTIYGDYKKDLPQNMQRTHHQMKAYWR